MGEPLAPHDAGTLQSPSVRTPPASRGRNASISSGPERAAGREARDFLRSRNSLAPWNILRSRIPGRTVPGDLGNRARCQLSDTCAGIVGKGHDGSQGQAAAGIGHTSL